MKTIDDPSVLFAFIWKQIANQPGTISIRTGVARLVEWLESEIACGLTIFKVQHFMQVQHPDKPREAFGGSHFNLLTLCMGKRQEYPTGALKLMMDIMDHTVENSTCALDLIIKAASTRPDCPTGY